MVVLLRRPKPNDERKPEHMRTGILSSIRTKYHTLSTVQKVIADYILGNASDVILLSIGSLAGKCGTSETTVMRFLRKLDFDSYQVFRVKIAQEISHKRMESIYSEIDRGDTIDSVMKKVISSTARSVEDLQQLVRADDISKCVSLMKSASRIFFTGVGASSFIAFDAYHKFLRLGLNVSASSDSHLMSILASHTTEKDLLVAVSHSGESRDLIDCVRLAKGNGAKVVAFTSYRGSSLMDSADVVLLSSSNETMFRSDALVSRILQLVIIDMLYVSMVLEMGPEAVKRINRSRLAVASRKR
jgi:RpiR family carbohydrate utilization transcriptional regulator